jgi:Delta-aminolevulinic acid dehydratase
MFPNTRLRRTRMHDWSRRLIQENYISSSDLILPIFIKEGKNVIEEIKSMPDVYKYSIDTLKKNKRSYKIQNPSSGPIS